MARTRSRMGSTEKRPSSALVKRLETNGSSRFMEDVGERLLPDDVNGGRRLRSRSNPVSSEALKKGKGSGKQQQSIVSKPKTNGGRVTKQSGPKALTKKQKDIITRFLRDVRENPGNYGSVGSSLWITKLTERFEESGIDVDGTPTSDDLKYWLNAQPFVKMVQDIKRLQKTPTPSTSRGSGSIGARAAAILGEKSHSFVLLTPLKQSGSRTSQAPSSVSTLSINHAVDGMQNAPDSATVGAHCDRENVVGESEDDDDDIYVMNEQGDWKSATPARVNREENPRELDRGMTIAIVSSEETGNNEMNDCQPGASQQARMAQRDDDQESGSTTDTEGIMTNIPPEMADDFSNSEDEAFKKDLPMGAAIGVPVDQGGNAFVAGGMQENLETMQTDEVPGGSTIGGPFDQPGNHSGGMNGNLETMQTQVPAGNALGVPVDQTGNDDVTDDEVDSDMETTQNPTPTRNVIRIPLGQRGNPIIAEVVNRNLGIMQTHMAEVMKSYNVMVQIGQDDIFMQTLGHQIVGVSALIDSLVNQQYPN